MAQLIEHPAETGFDTLARFVVLAASRNERRLKEAQRERSLGPLVAEALFLMSQEVHEPGDAVSPSYTRAGAGLDTGEAEALLARTGGNVTEAAKLGRVSRAAIYRACGLQKGGADGEAEAHRAAAAAD